MKNQESSIGLALAIVAAVGLLIACVRTPADTEAVRRVERGLPYYPGPLTPGDTDYGRERWDH